MKTVLIIDDDDAVRESLMDFFEDRGWCVFVAVSAEQALEILQHKSIDGAIVDIRLPGMDGNEFISAAGQVHRKLAFVIYTGSPEYRPSEAIVLLSSVAENVFIKPIASLAMLEHELLRQIEKCRAKKEPEHD